MPNLENQRTLRPDSSLFWMQIFSDKPTICMILLGFIWFTLGSWKWMAPDGDPLAEFLAEYGAIIWGGFAVTLAMAAACIGVALLRFYRIRYILTETGIIFGSGINYTEDIVPWPIINDVDMTRSVIEQLLGVGTIWISAENIRRPLYYLRHYEEIRKHLLCIVRNNYKAARRVTRV